MQDLTVHMQAIRVSDCPSDQRSHILAAVERTWYTLVYHSCELTDAADRPMQVVDEAAARTPGKRSLAMAAFARALRSIPTIISDNAGVCCKTLCPSTACCDLILDCTFHSAELLSQLLSQSLPR